MKPYFLVALTGDEVNNIIRGVGKEMSNGAVSVLSNGGGLENITVSLNPPTARVTALVIEKARELIPKGFDPKTSTVSYKVNDRKLVEGAEVTFSN